MCLAVDVMPLQGYYIAPCKGLVDGTKQRYIAGINFKPRKLLENAPTPTRRVHPRMMGSSCFTGELELVLRTLCWAATYGIHAGLFIS
jgi:hypothetical protein